MCEEKGMHDMLEAMLDAVEVNSIDHHNSQQQQQQPNSNNNSAVNMNGNAMQPLSEDEWDKRGRQMLENLVLGEFARKIASQYVLKKEESRAQQVYHFTQPFHIMLSLINNGMTNNR
jgi:hypothetical protein